MHNLSDIKAKSNLRLVSEICKLKSGKLGSEAVSKSTAFDRAKVADDYLESREADEVQLRP